MHGARASHSVRLHVPGGGDAATQVESAPVYCESELHASTMALCGLGHHAPVSIERFSNCGRNRTNGCGSARQSDGADTIADRGLLLFPTLKGSCLATIGWQG